MTGERVYIGTDGAASISSIVGLSSNTLVPADGLLTAGSAPFSALGVALVMTVAIYTEEDNSGSIYLRLMSGTQAALSNGSYPADLQTFETVALAASSVTAAPIALMFAPLDAAAGVGQCMRPSDELRLDPLSAGCAMVAWVMGFAALIAASSTLSQIKRTDGEGQCKAVQWQLLSSLLTGVGCVWLEYVLLLSRSALRCDGLTCQTFSLDIQLSGRVLALALLPACTLTFACVLLWSGRLVGRRSRVHSSSTRSSDFLHGQLLSRESVITAVTSHPKVDVVRERLRWWRRSVQWLLDWRMAVLVTAIRLQ